MKHFTLNDTRKKSQFLLPSLLFMPATMEAKVKMDLTGNPCKNTPKCCIFNTYGIPLAPFHTDNW